LRERFDSGESTPAIENKPEVGADVVYLLSTWNQLAGSRPSGFSAVPAIPLSEIVVGFHVFEMVEFCTLAEFIDWMQYLDGIAREYWNELNEEKRKQQQRPPPKKIIPAYR
jgi:hypothetical protein